MGYQLELRHVRYFLAVADELHFRKAAERLYMSQPGLSRQIKEMEEGLGIQLFERTNRSVALTKAGIYLQEELTRHVKGLENIVQHARLLHNGLLGELKLGYVGSAMQEVIPSLLITFQEQHPNVLFHLSEMDNQTQIDGLRSGDLDIGFVRLKRIPRELAAHPVLIEPFCLVLPTQHPVDAENFDNMLQLKDEPFILFDPTYSPSYYENVMQIFDDSGFSPIVSHNTVHAGSIYKLVENHFGVSIVPKSLQIHRFANVKFIELSRIPQRTTLSAVWNINNSNPLVNDLLIEIQKKAAE